MIIRNNTLSAPPTSSDEEARLKAVGRDLTIAETNLWLAYRRIDDLAKEGGVSGVLPTKVLLAYNVSRAKLVEAAHTWMEARDKAEVTAPDRSRRPEYPPKLLLPAQVGDSVSVGNIAVQYGQEGNLQQMPIILVPRLEKPEPLTAQTVVPWVPILVLLGVGITGLTIVYGIRSWQEAEVEYNSSLAEQSKTFAQSVDSATQSLNGLYTNCADTATSAPQKQECLRLATAAVVGSIGTLPQPQSPKRAWSLTEKLGTVFLVGAFGLAGWHIWQQRRN